MSTITAARGTPASLAPVESNRLAVALIATLMLACLLPYPFTTIILDAARDLVFAARIAQGELYPLQGPVINASAHLGPLWFYLLAPALATTKSTAAALALVGVLDALKFPFAYAIGQRVGGRSMGLFFALAMGFPNWSLGAVLLVTHTSLVQTTVLAAVLCAMRLHEHDTPGRWATLGLVLGLALHAHPATIVLFPLLLALFRAHPHTRWGGWMQRSLLLGTCLLLPFLPMLLHEARHGWPLLAQGARLPGIEISVGNSWQILVGGVVGGAALLSDHLVDPGWQAAVRLVLLGAAAVALCAVPLAWREARLRRAMDHCLLALVLGCIGLALLRERTPFYMALLLWPPVAGLMALGWHAAAVQFSRGKAALLALGWMLAVAGPGMIILRAQQGFMQVPTAALFDIANWRAPGDPKALLPAWQLDRLGHELCEQPGRVVLHAELGALFDAALGLSTRLQCGQTSRIGIGGGAEEAATHRLGLPPIALSRLGLRDGANWSQASRLQPRRVIAPATSASIPDGMRYPFRLQHSVPQQVHAWEFDAEPEETIVLTTPFRPYHRAQHLDAYANGQRQAPRLASYATSAFRCESCRAPVHWRLEVRTGLPEQVDIVTAVAPDR